MNIYFKTQMMLPNKILLKDCIEGIKEYGDNTFDVIIIDPPYNVGKDFGNDSDKQKMPDYLNWCKLWIEESYRVLKPNGSIFIYGFSEILAYIFVNIDYKTKRWLIWHYTNKTTPSINYWQKSHESIIHFWKGENKVFNVDDVREEYTKKFLKTAAGKKRKSTKGRYSSGQKETIYNANENGALPRDVIKVAALAGGAGAKERWFLCKTCDKVCSPNEKLEHEVHKIIIHPTQKPFDITKKLLLSSLPKDIKPKILIPFGGSGSETIVAKSMNCDYVGFDINPDYVKLANEWNQKYFENE